MLTNQLQRYCLLAFYFLNFVNVMPIWTHHESYKLHTLFCSRLYIVTYKQDVEQLYMSIFATICVFFFNTLCNNVTQNYKHHIITV